MKLSELGWGQGELVLTDISSRFKEMRSCLKRIPGRPHSKKGVGPRFYISTFQLEGSSSKINTVFESRERGHN